MSEPMSRISAASRPRAGAPPGRERTLETAAVALSNVLPRACAAYSVLLCELLVDPPSDDSLARSFSPTLASRA